MNYFKTARFFLYLAVFNVALVVNGSLFPFIVGKYVWFRSSVELSLIFFLLGILRAPRDSDRYIARLKKLFRNPLVIAVTAFTAAFLLACVFGVNPWYSFWSNFERGEGGFQILNLFTFFVLLITLFEEEKNWQRIFTFSLITIFLMMLYGVAAGFGVGSVVGPHFGDSGYRFEGSIGNPAYVAAYLIFGFFYATFLLSTKFRQNLKSPLALALWAMLLLCLVFFYLAATRGAFIGLIAAAAVFLAYFAYSHEAWRRRVLIGGIAILCAVVLLVLLQNTSLIKSLPGSRIFTISFSARTFEDRAIMWKTAWDGFLNRPIFGYGPENFLTVFDTHFNTKYYTPQRGFGAWFDRAHSVIFDYLSETGLVGLLAYLSMFVAFYTLFFRLIKRSKLNMSSTSRALVLALPVAYLVQGVILFDVLTIYFNLFLFLAFSVFIFQRAQESNA